jgi:hypothetical protein
MGKPIIWSGTNAKLINSGDLIDVNNNSLTNGGKANYTWTSHGLTVGGTADLGRPVYLVNATTLAFAEADTAIMAEVVGFIYAVLDANTVRLIVSGEIPTVGSNFLEGGGSLVPGTVYFLSVTPGKVTATEPTIIGYVSKPLGVASSTTRFAAFNMRGSVVGAANARTQITLPNNATQTVQDVSLYDAGSISGWVLITNSTAANTLRFYVNAPFAKYGGTSNYYISPAYVGDTPPTGFAMTVTAAGLIQVTLPSVTGYASAVINFALNAPAVGTNFPLGVDGNAIISGTIGAAYLPVASVSTSGIVNTSAQSFAGVKTFSNGLAFASSSLSDVQATIMGLKSYFHGTTYNGGIAPTVTSAQAGFVVVGASFVPYQMQANEWRLRFNVVTTFTAVSTTTASIAVNGVTARNVANYSQAVAGYPTSSSGSVTTASIAPNTGTITMLKGAGAYSGLICSGDIELDSKPTWAY